MLTIGLPLAVVVTACAGPADPGTVDEEEPPAPPVEEAAEADEAPSAPEPAAATELGELAAPLAWDVQDIDVGIKPALALDGNDVAHVAFLTEADMGAVFYATNAGGAFETTVVAEGYFYGPEDIAVGPDNLPVIAYHDHQELRFMPQLGDEVIAVSDGSAWTLITVEHPGHDGWDNDIEIDVNGNWHTASVDPSQFNGQDGVEYATNAGGEIVVESIGAGPIAYEFGPSIELGSDGSPGISYYNDRSQQLEYAQRGDGGWTIEVVDANGNAGRYSSLAYDSAGNPHIAYFVSEGGDAGVVRHAWRDSDGAWQVENVDTLEAVRTGMAGARKITSLVIDGDDVPHLAYTDRNEVVYAQRGDDGWAGQVAVTAGDNLLGQLVDMQLDSEGMPHLVSYSVTTFTPLEGVVFYATGRPE